MCNKIVLVTIGKKDYRVIRTQYYYPIKEYIDLNKGIDKGIKIEVEYINGRDVPCTKIVNWDKVNIKEK